MRVAIISKAANLGGGGSKVATTLARLLQQNGHFCHHFRRDSEYGYQANQSNLFGPYEKLFKWLKYRFQSLGFQESVPLEYPYLKSEMKRLKIDIIHFHDITTALSPITIALLSRHFTIVWTMHDFSPFTGGCINPLGCARFTSYCGKCPQKLSWPVRGTLDLTRFHLRLKRWLHSKKLHLVSPSIFLKSQASLSGVDPKKISVINNSVDTNTFFPMDKSEVKITLGLNPQKLTLLIIAYRINSPFKGTDDALKVLHSLGSNIQIIVVGKVTPTDKQHFEGLDCTFVGYVTEEEQLNKLYNAADIFLNCSKADNFPLVVLESLAAGTPVYGYATGGIVEMITNGINGYLVKTGNWKELYSEIAMLRIEDLKLQSTTSRNVALESYSDEVFINKTVSLYKKLLRNNDSLS
ncbi:glycosyltransferase [Aliiglaciecola sp. 2_MG-2023]|uniref:glycosyltransferase n=1 Tax=unclassified Aliiglaciecola TaxID=2593648 RepID=UPI0026E28201|nr:MULTISPECIES: glycosyltransferase [unclassified Aliiglaciecola]MDO6709366.1 glycosyltransferase [Aliiglaciecola sp. 2_MG-2023]MDO6750514.1 glycosyltransferase [Aliiglaciecola sp. 1_MG-2023]